jgi:uncharacterized membrane protein YhaH (DUF805 family)
VSADAGPGRNRFGTPQPVRHESTTHTAGGYTAWDPAAAWAEQQGITELPPDQNRAPLSVGPVGALVAAATRVIDYSGRSSRSEFWWVSLITGVPVLLLGWQAGAFSTVPAQAASANSLMLPLCAVIAVFMLPLTVRRLHDTDRRGWWMLLSLLGIGAVLLVFYYLEQSYPRRNRFGPGPF